MVRVQPIHQLPRPQPQAHPPQQLAQELQAERQRSAWLMEELRAAQQAVASADSVAHHYTTSSQLAQEHVSQLQHALSQERARRERAEGDLKLARLELEELERLRHERPQP